MANLRGSSFSDNFYNKKHIILTIILINFKLDPVVSSTYQQIDVSLTHRFTLMFNLTFIQWSGISVESVYLREA